METNEYRISELAEKAGVTRRTVHYYIGRGLLPPAEGEGLGSTYNDGHLYRLLYIKCQQEAFLPLEEIRKRLQSMTDEEVRQSVERSVGAQKDANAFASETGIQLAAADLAEASPEQQRQHERDKQLEQNERLQRRNEHLEQPEHYERIDLGLGLELHVPFNNKRAAAVAGLLVEYARKVVKEG